jgi:hypothetical protein
VNLEPYAPAASLLLLCLMGLIAFVRVRVLMKRFGASETARGPRDGTGATAPQPWWATHLDDYTREPPPAPEACEGERVPCREDYEMAASVELWFGDLLVAVRPGSDTDARFQRFAAVLREELRAARERP